MYPNLQNLLTKALILRGHLFFKTMSRYGTSGWVGCGRESKISKRDMLKNKLWYLWLRWKKFFGAGHRGGWVGRGFKKFDVPMRDIGLKKRWPLKIEILNFGRKLEQGLCQILKVRFCRKVRFENLSPKSKFEAPKP